ncbi:MAG: flap endonuclease-1 [Nitrososphaeria archaeon]
MGVDIKEIINPRKISLNELEGKVLAIDAYNALYQFLSIIRGKTGEPLRDSKGNITSHLSGLFYRTMSLLTIGIKPIYIFDGRPPQMKSLEIGRRKAVKEKARVKYSLAIEKGEMEKARKYAKLTSYLTDEMVKDSKKLLSLLGVPWAQAPSEGEATASHLSTTGVAYAAVSQDYDALLFGGKRLCRNITISGKRKLPGRNLYQEIEPEEILLDDVLAELKITREQLIDIGILVGTDFDPNGFRGYGPVKALKAIKQYGSLEKIPDIEEELKRIDYNAIREIFLKPDVLENFHVNFKEIDEEGVLSFLCGMHEFSEDRVSNAFKRYREVEAEKKKKELSLDKWF